MMNPVITPRTNFTQTIFSIILLFMILLPGCSKRQTSLPRIEWVTVPPGHFMMGDSNGQWDEDPIHRVIICEQFKISKSEITANQYRLFKPEYSNTGEHAAVGISWYEAAAFCRWLSEKQNGHYRLPTEAEWEYVCRNRTNLGVKDMLDSTLEWCRDWYGPYADYEQTDPNGANSGLARVVRGGLPDRFIRQYSFSEEYYYRPTNRSGMPPSFSGFFITTKQDSALMNDDPEPTELSGLTGIVYDDLAMTKPLQLFDLLFVNSTEMNWISMNNWAAHWRGYLQVPVSGKIRFHVVSDHKVTITLGGRPLTAMTTFSGSFTAVRELTSGIKYPLEIQYFHEGGRSLLKLSWILPGNKEEIIPPNAFSHTRQKKYDTKKEYRQGIFSRYVNPNIGFRIVRAGPVKTIPVTNPVPFSQQCIRQHPPPNPQIQDQKPYYRRRFLHPLPPEKSSRDEIIYSGLHPAIGSHNHHATVAECSNGDLLTVYFSSIYEDAPEVLLIASRLRYGADRWDMPAPLVDIPDVNDVSPLLWVDSGKIYLFWGNIHLRGGYPFQWIESTDNGASFSEVQYPDIKDIVDGFEPQPVTSVFRDKDGIIYLACDGVGAHSMLWASRDKGRTWFDTGGRTAGRHTAIVPLLNGDFLGLGGKKSDINGYMPVSLSTDKGKTWQVSQSVFPSLGGGQRPALIRLNSGRLLFAGDFQRKDGYQPPGFSEKGAFVAYSDDEGKTWAMKKLPGTLVCSDESTAQTMGGETIGYVNLTQSSNGMIHLVTSKNAPALHFEFNEAWLLNQSRKESHRGLKDSSYPRISKVMQFEEKYDNGKNRAIYSGGIADDGRFLLHGPEKFFYQNGDLQYEAFYNLGAKQGYETFYSRDGHIQWQRIFEDDRFSWTQYWANGGLRSQSSWKSMKCDGPALYADRSGKQIKKVIFVEGKIKK